MRLWTERGFETGIEDTTIDEIVQAAGVTKGTFYSHFADKEEILLELGYQTASLLYEEAARCVNAKRSIDGSLRRRDERAGRQRQGRAARRGRPCHVRVPAASAARDEPPAMHPSFAQALEMLFARARDEGEVTDKVDPAEMAQIVEALYVESLMEWSRAG